jgi:multidrug transporter EmrE-like cation transporter
MNQIFNYVSQVVPTWVLLLLVAGCIVVGDTIIKYWTGNQKDWMVVIVFIFYTLSGLLYFPTLLNENLTTATVIWSILSLVGSVLVGLLVFRETVSTIQGIGIMLGILSVILIKI